MKLTRAQRQAILIALADAYYKGVEDAELGDVPWITSMHYALSAIKAVDKKLKKGEPRGKHTRPKP